MNGIAGNVSRKNQKNSHPYAVNIRASETTSENNCANSEPRTIDPAKKNATRLIAPETTTRVREMKIAWRTSRSRIRSISEKIRLERPVGISASGSDLKTEESDGSIYRTLITIFLKNRTQTRRPSRKPDADLTMPDHVGS